MRRILVVSVVALVGACGRGNMTAPTPSATAPFGLSGGVVSTASRPLAQARVEAVDGPQKRAVAMTDDAGRFVFTPIFTSRFTLRASKEGYRDQSAVIAGGQTPASFRLDSMNNPFDATGTYEITLDADVACRDLPSTARRRTYSASFTSTQGDRADYYFGTLSGADFVRGAASYPDWNVLTVKLVEDVAEVFFSDPPIWEHLTRDADLVIDGQGTGTVRADTSHLSFAGNFLYCSAPIRADYPECEVPEISCRSQNHQLTITRK